MRMLRRMKGVTLRDKVKSVDIRKELGVKKYKRKSEKCDYAGMDTCREWKKTTKWEQLLTWECQEKDQGGDQGGDGRISSEGTCRHCGSPRRMPRTEHSGNQEFGPLKPPSGKRRRRSCLALTLSCRLLLAPPASVWCASSLWTRPPASSGRQWPRQPRDWPPRLGVWSVWHIPWVRGLQGTDTCSCTTLNPDGRRVVVMN